MYAHFVFLKLQIILSCLTASRSRFHTWPAAHYTPACTLHSQDKSGTEWVQALADVSRSALCCHSNETRAPIANPPNSAQLGGTPTVPPSYIRVHAVVWEFGEGQTHRRPWPTYKIYTFRLIYASREMQQLLAVPAVSKVVGRQGFSYAAPSIWNEIP